MGGTPYHKVEVEGQTLKLRITAFGMCEVEEKYGVVLHDRDPQNFKLRDYINILQASLYDYHEDEASRKLASKIFDTIKEKKGPKAVFGLISDLLGDFFPRATEEKLTNSGKMEEPEKNEEALGEEETTGLIS